MAILSYKYFGDGKIPTVEIDWRRWATMKICPECIYYDFCGMNQDCKALKVLVNIYEDLDSGNPED